MGGGGSNSAQREAQQAEKERQAKIASTQKNIERLYADPKREADINAFTDATRQFYRTDADRQQQDAARDLRFAVARSGQTGGQLQADLGGRLYETYQRGILEADRRAQQAAADLRAQDQASKQNLFSLAAAGLDATTAGQNATATLRNNLAGAQATARESSLGDLFGSFADVYKNSIEQGEKRRAERDVYSTLYAPSQYGQGYKGGDY